MSNVQKTAAEQGFDTLYNDIADGLPGDARIGEKRKQAMEQFASLGLPHRRVEEWRYTDLKSLMQTAFVPQASEAITEAQLTQMLGTLAGIDAVKLVFIDGRYSTAMSDELVEGVLAVPMAQALDDGCFVDAFLEADQLEGMKEDAVTSLNTALMADGLALNISRKPAKPVHLICVHSGQNENLITLRNHINIEDGADFTLLESHVAAGDAGLQSNSLTRMGIGAGAVVEHIKFQNENVATTHLATLKANLGKDAVLREHQFNMGGDIVRNQHFIRFDGEHSMFDMSGVTLVRNKQHCDTTLFVDHAVPNCKSRENVKAVMDDKGKAIVQAKVVVRPHAQKTDGKQMMRGLMLSETCEFNAKPELEIYADDVECGHGATSGKIDEDLLFYLRSRGITEKEARSLLIQAFVGDVIEKVSHEEIRDSLTEYARSWLVEQNS